MHAIDEISTLTCIARRRPIGCVNAPEKIQPTGTQIKLIELSQEIWDLVKTRSFSKLGSLPSPP